MQSKRPAHVLTKQRHQRIYSPRMLIPIFATNKPASQNDLPLWTPFSGHTHRDRQTDGQTDRETDRQKDRQAGRQADRQTERQTHRHTDRQADRPTERQTGRRTEPQTDKQTPYADYFLNRGCSTPMFCIDNPYFVTLAFGVHFGLLLCVYRKLRLLLQPLKKPWEPVGHYLLIGSSGPFPVCAMHLLKTLRRRSLHSSKI